MGESSADLGLSVSVRFNDGCSIDSGMRNRAASGFSGSGCCGGGAGGCEKGDMGSS